MHMIARVGFMMGAGMAGGALMWVTSHHEIKCINRAAATERNSLNRKLRELELRFAAFRDEVTVRLLIRDSVNDDDPMIRSIFHPEEK